jgi:hypothetical protein
MKIDTNIWEEISEYEYYQTEFKTNEELGYWDGSKRHYYKLKSQDKKDNSSELPRLDEKSGSLDDCQETKSELSKSYDSSPDILSSILKEYDEIEYEPFVKAGYGDSADVIKIKRDGNWRYFKKKERFPIRIKLIANDILQINDNGSIDILSFDDDSYDFKFRIYKEEFETLKQSIKKAEEIGK